MADHATVKKCIIILSAAYPRFQVTPDTGRVYAELLQDIPDDLLIAATKQHATTSKWFPSVAELREIVQNITALASGIRNAEEAWVNVQIAVRRYGWYGESIDPDNGGGWRTPSMLSELEVQAVNGLGGWKMLCQSDNGPADRAHFLKIYASLLQRQTERVAMLPEIAALVNQLEKRMAASQLEGGK